jgi:arylsulfatase A-like enzyme
VTNRRTGGATGRAELGFRVGNGRRLALFNDMTSVKSLFAFLIGFLTACVHGVEPAAAVLPAKPNIVFILADDLGYTDLGCFGSKYYETPNIDRLAAQGMKFTSGYSCGPNCVPTRAALLSGKYGARTGVYTVGGIDRFAWQTRPLRPVDNVEKLPADTIPLMQSLKNAGYATGMVGKWHLGNSGPGHHPMDRGFDEFFGFMGGGHSYVRGAGIQRGRQAIQEPEYLTDAFGREATAFIRRHHGEPFFLYLAFNAVHTPLESKPELEARFKAKAAVGGHQNATYAAMGASLDENVGRVLGVLDELKLADRTLVIFSSDNGGVGGYQREGINAKDITDNAPLRGGKGMLYEGGIRVPYLFRWPGKIAAGSVSEEPINSVDLYPTLMEVAGAKPPAEQVLDGTSYFKVLTAAEKAERPPLFWHFPGYLGAGGNTWRTLPAGAIRAGDWKLQEFFEDGRIELYNLRDDVGEKKNLAAVNPEKAKELQTQLVAWRERTKAPMPGKNTAGGGGAKGAKKRK